MLNLVSTLFNYFLKSTFAKNFKACDLKVRFLRIFIVFIITIITSSSILFDWSDYAHIATLKNSGYSVLDRYDEISTTQRTSSYEIAVVSSPAPINENDIEIYSFISIQCIFHFIKPDVQYPSKIKSYLHLLQLF